MSKTSQQIQSELDALTQQIDGFEPERQRIINQIADNWNNGTSKLEGQFAALEAKAKAAELVRARLQGELTAAQIAEGLTLLESLSVAYDAAQLGIDAAQDHLADLQEQVRQAEQAVYHATTRQGDIGAQLESLTYDIAGLGADGNAIRAVLWHKSHIYRPLWAGGFEPRMTTDEAIKVSTAMLEQVEEVVL